MSAHDNRNDDKERDTTMFLLVMIFVPLTIYGVISFVPAGKITLIGIPASLAALFFSYLFADWFQS